MIGFMELYAAGDVKRWHTHQTLKEQTLSAHQWGVAMIVMEIAPMYHHVVRVALTHDLGEVITGDTPYTGKGKFNDLREATERAEGLFAEEHDLPVSVQLNDKEQRILRWADMFEAYLFALKEVRMGNQLMQPVVNNALRALNQMGPPNGNAQLLMESTHA